MISPSSHLDSSSSVLLYKAFGVFVFRYLKAFLIAIYGSQKPRMTHFHNIPLFLSFYNAYEITFSMSVSPVDIKSMKASSRFGSFPTMPLAANTVPSSYQALANYLLNCVKCFVFPTLLGKSNAISHRCKSQQRKTTLPVWPCLKCFAPWTTVSVNTTDSFTPPMTLGKALSIFKERADVSVLRLRLKRSQNYYNDSLLNYGPALGHLLHVLPTCGKWRRGKGDTRHKFQRVIWDCKLFTHLKQGVKQKPWDTTN